MARYRRKAVSEAERARRQRFEVWMDDYYYQRQAYLLQMESETGMYDVEVEEYKQRNPPVTFKKFLIGNACLLATRDDC